MPRIVDLTMPIEPHFRWKVERKLVGDFANGDAFQVTWIGWSVHGFTHIDAPRHMVPGGLTTDAFTLESLVGDARVVDLTSVEPNQAIDAERLAKAAPDLEAGEIVLLKTAWDARRSHHTPEFWTKAPYLTREACEWLLARKPRTIGFDFPQDYPIRGLLTGVRAQAAAGREQPRVVRVQCQPVVDVSGRPCHVPVLQQQVHPVDERVDVIRFELQRVVQIPQRTLVVPELAGVRYSDTSSTVDSVAASIATHRMPMLLVSSASSIVNMKPWNML